MPLIAMRNVNFRFSGPYLLAEADFQLEAGERVCLLGRNGCGKSTFLRLLRGRLTPETGEIIRQNHLRIGMLEQTVEQKSAQTVFDVVAQGLGRAGKLLAEYHSLAHKNKESDQKENSMLIQLGNKLDQAGDWNKLNVAKTVISQIGLDPDASFNQLSAGLKRRVLLAKALAAEPDLLILDEPTNHLDIEAIGWMEDFLLKLGKTLLFVTHDRRFLKKLATRIIELDRGRIFSYDCGYEEYLKRREQHLAAEEKHRKLFDKKLAQEERWIRQGVRERRKRNEGRVKALIKMRQQRAQRRNLEGLANIQINQAERSGDLVVKASKVDFAYDNCNTKIVDQLDTIITRGDRIGIIGPNGSGKTTLLKLLLGHLSPSAGNVRLGKNVQCAYFDQLHGQLDSDKSIWENIGQGYDTVTINGRKKHVISYLMDFLFLPDKVKMPVSDLSGGERNRLQIAKMFTQPSNVLVLDEPTNDLDIETLELLEEMLIEYPGTVLLVSHDRVFLNNVVTSTLVLEGQGRVKEYAGGYDDWLAQRAPAPDETKQSKSNELKKAKQPRKNQNQPKKLSYMQARKLQELPDTIEKLEKQIELLHDKMAEPSFYKQPGSTIARTKSRVEKLQNQLEQAYDQWETLEALNPD